MLYRTPRSIFMLTTKYMRLTVNCLLLSVLFLFLGACSTLNVYIPGSKGELLEPQIFTFEDGNSAISYSFPLGHPNPDSAVLFFISGSGCASIASRFPGYFEPIKDAIDANVFILQKRGIDYKSNGANCSDYFNKNDFYEQIVSDQREFINSKIKSINGNPAPIVLIGASEGGIIASKIAESNPKITHLGLISSGGSTMRSNLLSVSKKSLFMRASDAAFAEIESDPESFDRTVWGHSYKYWSSFLDIDIGSVLSSLRIPVVLAMGDQDKSVPIDSVEKLRDQASAHGRTNVRFMIFSDADHRLQNTRTGESYAPIFLKELINIVKGK